MRPRAVVVLALTVPALILGSAFGLLVWGKVSGYQAILAGPTVEATVLGNTRCTARAWECSPRGGDVAAQVRFDTPYGTRTAYAASSNALLPGEQVRLRYDRQRPRRVILVNEWEQDRRDLLLLARIVLALGIVLPPLGLLLFIRSRRARTRV